MATRPQALRDRLTR